MTARAPACDTPVINGTTERPPSLVIIPQSLLDPRGIDDPPPPYPSPERRTRIHRSARRHRTAVSQQLYGASPLEQDHPADYSGLASSPTERTRLLDHPSSVGSTRRYLLRPRSNSHSSTIGSSSSHAPSLAQTVLSLFHDPSEEDLSRPHLYHQEVSYDGEASQSHDTHGAPHSKSRWPLLSWRSWRRYFRPLCRRAYHTALFHLLVLNFPFALIVWIYLFLFTLTGTTLLITLPIGAVLCFLDLLGARTFARGELALQTKFHGPLAYSPPYPSWPIFQRPRLLLPSEMEHGAEEHVCYETSFYRNTHAMFTDSTTYQALFYFLVIKPGITLGITILLIVVVPVSYALIFPAPLMLRLVRKLGIWQANVAVEGLYHAMS
ncbi:hypothetical protein BKA82DRAFT_996172 [Pisolithus tinctorius]|uniref:Uncharacterized protein n=1 Tax=Pisolithus tinctorius Marx 270 TaxID=870435 RepID=A0A0C3PKZ3_PISTI|nr:hypothetical protein BKA82DRAFT_996172 [Pisolithus tinctorius]KIO09351.1 hypothetical protein M404DRAFT_996172 [Pisolithus tinctorius Marx 270]